MHIFTIFYIMIITIIVAVVIIFVIQIMIITSMIMLVESISIIIIISTLIKITSISIMVILFTREASSATMLFFVMDRYPFTPRRSVANVQLCLAKSHKCRAWVRTINPWIESLVIEPIYQHTST